MQCNSLILSKALPRIVGKSRSGGTLSNHLFKIPAENTSLDFSSSFPKDLHTVITSQKSSQLPLNSLPSLPSHPLLSKPCYFFRLCLPSFMITEFSVSLVFL